MNFLKKLSKSDIFSIICFVISFFVCTKEVLILLSILFILSLILFFHYCWMGEDFKYQQLKNKELEDNNDGI